MKQYSLRVVVAAALFACIATGCGDPSAEVPTLEEGKWTGTAMPMGHPEQRTELTYRISNTLDGINMTIGTTFNDGRPGRDVEMTVDTLYFVFDEHQQDVELHCALGLQPNGNYEGKCIDSDGKWTWFMMRPPDFGVGDEA